MASKDGSVPKRTPRIRRVANSCTAYVQKFDSEDEGINEKLSPPPMKKAIHNATTSVLTPGKQEPTEPAPAQSTGSAIVHAPAHSKETAIVYASGSGGCLVCGKDDDHARLLICEVCGGEHHTYCLVPPLHDIPEGEWFCDRCKQVDNLEAMVASLPDSYTSRFGEICWAQGGVGYGWWPAVIYDPRLTIGVARMQAIKNLGKKHLVYFFECTEAPFEILPDSKIMYWEQGILEDCHLGKTAKGRLAEFRCALHAASIEESKPKERRLDWNHQGAGSSTLPPSPLRAPPPDSRKHHKQSNRKEKLNSGGAAAIEKEKVTQRTISSAVSDSAALKQRPKKKRRSEESDTRVVARVTDDARSSSAMSIPLDTRVDGEMYCTVLRRRGSEQGPTPLGFVQVPSLQKSTFEELRRVIENDLVPDAISPDWDWRFWVPNLGPISIKQEAKLGPLLAFLLQTSTSEATGNGMLQSPVQIILGDAPNPR